ncbi:MAG: Abi-alpha family protein [Candidatus Gracilibacteria bacterium]|nr:Abi-alpha family protein [Candidatus Gracilibacteria bacterium]
MKVKTPGTEIEIGGEDYNALAKFVNFIIPGYVDEVGIKQDNAKFKRFENANKLFIRAKKITEGVSEELQEPPLKISMPLIENASLESEDELQEKWANLLANSLTNKKDIKPAFIEILKELSSIEVKILDKIYEEAKNTGGILTNIQFSSEKIAQIFLISIDEVRVIIDNLYRLRLAEAPGVQGIQMGGFFPVGKTNDIFQITFLGIKFIEACKFST